MNVRRHYPPKPRARWIKQSWAQFTLTARYGFAPVALAVMLALGVPTDAGAERGKNRGRSHDRHHSERGGNPEINEKLDDVIEAVDSLLEERSRVDVIPNGTTADFVPSANSGPFIAADTAICPDWAMPGGQAYTFRTDEWGTPYEVPGAPGSSQRGLAGRGDGNAQQSAACAWVAACNGDRDCYARCPVAMAIGHGESGWYPGSYAWDGRGRGLWQVNYANTEEEWPGCSYNYNTDTSLGTDNPPTPTSPVVCPSLNPIENAKKTVQFTSGGRYFNPAYRCWSTCNADCAPPDSPGYSCSGAPNGANNPPNFHDGPGQAQQSLGSCDNAIAAITGSPFDRTYEAPGRCDLGSVLSVCQTNPTWACDHDDANASKCGLGEPPICIDIPVAGRESCDD
jgi:hypothetical protein